MKDIRGASVETSDANFALTRRMILGAGAALASSANMAFAQVSPTDEVIDLWPGNPPGKTDVPIVRKIDDQSHDPAKPDRWTRGIDRPVLVVRRPARPNGSAVLVMPGGGYEFLSYDNEGTSQARWLNARGVTAFILLYRLPGEGWAQRRDVPLQDAQRAMRIIRSRAASFGIRPDRVAALGFSAGGHLAGSLATRHHEKVYAPVDAADREDARPALVGLLYPVVSLFEPFTHGGSRDALLGPDASEDLRRTYSVETRVNAETPPLFLVHATDDGLVPVANSIALFEAMRRNGHSVAMHVFEEAGHGFGNRLPPSISASAWPGLFTTFATRHGVGFDG